MTTTRRRGAELVREIREAVLAEIAERGYGGTTYDRVADRARTSKPVLYRRWPTKARMVMDALAAAHPGVVIPPDTGSLAGDLKAFLTTVRSSIEASGRQTVLCLLAELDTNGGATVRELLFAKGAGVLEPLVERARRRGELGDRPVPAGVILVPLDLARHELIVAGALTDDALDTIVDQIAVPLLVMRSGGGAGDE